MKAEDDAMMAETSQSDPEGLEPLEFDEREFVRSARARSVRRTFLIAASVVLVGVLSLAGAWVVWETAIQTQSNRIDEYQRELIALSQPNTYVAGGSAFSHRRFPGARNTYRTYRPVGSTPVPKGEVAIDYDFWGGEVVSTEGGGLAWANPKREFSGTEMVPSLRFVYPGRPSTGESVEPQFEHAAEAAQIKALTQDAQVRLDSAPASATAELAVSFRDLKTLDEVRALLAEDVLLNWGAVDVWELKDGPFVPADGRLVGVGFVGPDGSVVPVAPMQLEKNLSSTLRQIARSAPKGTADKCIQSAEYIERNGVEFYGAVVTGPVHELRQLLANTDVSSATLGSLVAPWQ